MNAAVPASSPAETPDDVLGDETARLAALREYVDVAAAPPPNCRPSSASPPA